MEGNKMFQCEGESILPDVEELPEFHPDHLSTLSDIQEELEKLDPFETVKGEEITLIDDVNVVDHEVTIGDEQIDEELKEGTIECQSTENPTTISGIIEKPYNTSEGRALGGSIIIKTPTSNASASGRGNVQRGPEKQRIVNKHSIVHNPPPLKAIRPLPEGLRANSSFITVPQQKKNMVTKVIFSPTSQASSDGSTIMLTESSGQTIRIVGQNKQTVLPNSPRTLTLAQAREMGLFPGKMQLVQNQSKGIVRTSVMVPGNKQPMSMVKASPTKILPLPTSGQLQAIAPSPTVNTLVQSPQKIITIRQGGPSVVRPGGFSGTLLTSGPAGAAGQLLQIPATVNQDTLGQIHQIQLPGKQVQYVRLVHTPVATTSATVTATSSVSLEAMKSEPIFISATSAPTLVNTMTPTPQSQAPPPPVSMSTPVPVSIPNLKMMPITPTTPTQQSSNTFERILVSPGLTQLKGKTDAKPQANNIVMVPAEYVKQFKQNSVPTTQSTTSQTQNGAMMHTVVPSAKPAAVSTPAIGNAKEVLVPKEPVLAPAPSHLVTNRPKEPPNGLRPRKPCNCTKSQCLKLKSGIIMCY